MESFAIASIVSLLLILMSAAIFYEILAHIWVRLPKLEGRPRLQILITIVSAFIGHTITIWLFGTAYYLLANHAGFGDLRGNTEHEFMDYIYFSGVSYSSLGLGDVYPVGGLRLLIAVEALLGLILIGWTITFTYLVTDKYLTHRLKRHTKRDS
jgi:hypothetical protein